MSACDPLIDVQLLGAPVQPLAFAPFPQPAGAECIFLGRTRRESHPQYGELRRLSYEAYRPMALKVLGDLARAAQLQFSCLAIRIHHTVGDVPLGEASVLVQVVCGHRGSAFDACRFLIDRLKTQGADLEARAVVQRLHMVQRNRPRNRPRNRYGAGERMRSWIRLFSIVYWLALTIWISALLTTAIAAAAVFGQLKLMPIHLDSYADYPADEHWSLAAGTIMEQVFAVVDLIQFIAAPLLLVALVVQLAALGYSLRRASNIIRAACILGAAALLAFRMITLAPEMNRELHQYWQAAADGNVEVARGHRDAFARDHPAAQRVFSISFILLLVASAASAVALAELPPSSRRTLEQPRLLRQT